MIIAFTMTFFLADSVNPVYPSQHHFISKMLQTLVQKLIYFEKDMKYVGFIPSANK